MAIVANITQSVRPSDTDHPYQVLIDYDSSGEFPEWQAIVQRDGVDEENPRFIWFLQGDRYVGLQISDYRVGQETQLLNEVLTKIKHEEVTSARRREIDAGMEVHRAMEQSRYRSMRENAATLMVESARNFGV